MRFSRTIPIVAMLALACRGTPEPEDPYPRPNVSQPCELKRPLTLGELRVQVGAWLGADYMPPPSFSAAIRLRALNASAFPDLLRADSAWLVVQRREVPFQLGSRSRFGRDPTDQAPNESWWIVHEFAQNENEQHLLDSLEYLSGKHSGGIRIRILYGTADTAVVTLAHCPFVFSM
jgi:hypothetical protein